MALTGQKLYKHDDFIETDAFLQIKAQAHLQTRVQNQINLPSVLYKAALATVSTRSFLRASETLRRQATSRLPKELEAMFLQQKFVFTLLSAGKLQNSHSHLHYNLKNSSTLQVLPLQLY